MVQVESADPAEWAAAAAPLNCLRENPDGITIRHTAAELPIRTAVQPTDLGAQRAAIRSRGVRQGLNSASAGKAVILPAPATEDLEESAAPAASEIAAEIRPLATARAGQALAIAEEAAGRIASAAVTFPEAEPATGVLSLEETRDSADGAQPAIAAVALRASEGPAAAVEAFPEVAAAAGEGNSLSTTSI